MIKRLTTTVPPEAGPQSQGLNISYNTVKTVKQSGEKINGGYRQSITQHRAKKRI